MTLIQQIRSFAGSNGCGFPGLRYRCGGQRFHLSLVEADVILDYRRLLTGKERARFDRLSLGLMVRRIEQAQGL